MAIITAEYSFDLYGLDLHKAFKEQRSQQYEKDDNQEINGVTYRAYYNQAWEDSPDLVRVIGLYDRHNDLEYDERERKLVGGTAELFAVAFDYERKTIIEFVAENVSLSAAEYRAATLTADRADDRRFFDKLFVGDDKIRLSNDHDRIDGMGGNDSILGGDGNDTLTGGSGNDTLRGEAGNDVLYLDSGNDVISGGDGTDTIIVSGNTSTTLKLYVTAGQNTGMGIDTITGIENARGGGGNDIIHGTDGRNVLIGEAGHDTLFGRSGNDLLEGRDGNDVLYDGDGNDVVHGNAGNDRFYDGAGNDSLYGGDGNDRFYLGSGNDILDGGSGIDAIYASGGVDVTLRLYLTGGQNTGMGTDTLRGIENIRSSGGDDALYGGAGKNVLISGGGNDTLVGRQGDDVLNGQSGNDVLKGGTGNDHLTGGTGSDTLYGGAGNDVLSGGAGKDYLRGGAGADVFKFLSTASSSRVLEKSDIIRDFQQGQDVIDLSKIDASVSLPGNNAFTFRDDGVIGTGDGGVVTYVHLDRPGSARDFTVIWIDTDSDRTAESKILLNGLHDLTADDFIL